MSPLATPHPHSLHASSALIGRLTESNREAAGKKKKEDTIQNTFGIWMADILKTFSDHNSQTQNYRLFFLPLCMFLRRRSAVIISVRWTHIHLRRSLFNSKPSAVRWRWPCQQLLSYVRLFLFKCVKMMHRGAYNVNKGFSHLLLRRMNKATPKVPRELPTLWFSVQKHRFCSSCNPPLTPAHHPSESLGCCGRNMETMLTPTKTKNTL